MARRGSRAAWTRRALWAEGSTPGSGAGRLFRDKSVSLFHSPMWFSGLLSASSPTVNFVPQILDRILPDQLGPQHLDFFLQLRKHHGRRERYAVRTALCQS